MIPISPTPTRPALSGRRTSSSSGRTPSSPSYFSPPGYTRSASASSPYRSPMMVLEENPSVPPPIYLRSSSPQGQSNKGDLKIHVPAWGVAMVRPPQQPDLHPLDTEARQPPLADTVLSGALEVIMKERRRCQAISVGVQSVCRLYGGVRGWEEDGIFERGVEVLGGDADGIWLEQGSQSFTFNILLPATLATHDFHQFGCISYILTARVEGVPSSSGIVSFFKSTKPHLSDDIPFKVDFERVIARSDRRAQEIASQGHGSPTSLSARLSPHLSSLHLDDGPDMGAAQHGDGGSPSLTGLYHRRQSTDVQGIPPINIGSPVTDDRRSLYSTMSKDANDPSAKSEKNGWLKGDLCASRSLFVTANPGPSGGPNKLNMRREGSVDGLGPWILDANSDVFSISAVVLLSFSFPEPSPDCTIFLIRLLLVQDYSIISPRRPNDAPYHPETAKQHVVYSVGRAHKAGEKYPPHGVDSLWRGQLAGGKGDESGWSAKVVARLPDHDKIRPSTNPGTITPIRVRHELLFQVFYSVEGTCVRGDPVQGPGELRMLSVKMPVIVPSCCCTMNALELPSYEYDTCRTQAEMNTMLASPPLLKECMCGKSFSELGEAAMKRMQALEGTSGSSGQEAEVRSGLRQQKIEMERAQSPHR